MTVGQKTGRLAEFRFLLKSWDGGDGRFDEIVECGVSLLPNGQRILADEFQVAPSTVGRWISGIAKPHQRIKRQIVVWLRRQILGSI